MNDAWVKVESRPGLGLGQVPHLCLDQVSHGCLTLITLKLTLSTIHQ